MATQESWATRREIIDSFQGLKNHIQNYKTDFARLKVLKETILEDPTKKADMKLLFDQDTTISMAQVVAEYARVKVIYDWLAANGG